MVLALKVAYNKWGFGPLSLKNKLQSGFNSSVMLYILATSALIQPQVWGIKCWQVI